MHAVAGTVGSLSLTHLRCLQGGWSRGQHALGAAIDGEEPSILRLLLKWGADPDRVNAVRACPRAYSYPPHAACTIDVMTCA